MSDQKNLVIDDREINKRRVAARTTFQWLKGVFIVLVVLGLWTGGLISPVILLFALVKGKRWWNLSSDATAVQATI